MCKFNGRHFINCSHTSLCPHQWIWYEHVKAIQIKGLHWYDEPFTVYNFVFIIFFSCNQCCCCFQVLTDFWHFCLWRHLSYRFINISARGNFPNSNVLCSLSLLVFLIDLMILICGWLYQQNRQTFIWHEVLQSNPVRKKSIDLILAFVYVKQSMCGNREWRCTFNVI